jgi:glyoxylase-like metal-dependent hydrolase (beta-lactamase superfamily II)
MANRSEAEQLEELEQQEPPHPGWLDLGDILQTTDSFFDQFFFMLGFDMSSNIYVMKGEDLTIIDPGNDYTAFLELFKHGYSPVQIKKIVLTHGHSDHSLGVFELLRSYPSIVKNGGFELILHGAGPKQLKETIRRLGCRLTELDGGEILDLNGHPWEVIHTPGHSLDSICFYHAPTKTVVTGDTVQPHQMAEPDKEAGGRLDHYLFGIKQLLKRDIENVLPGHGAPIAKIGRRIVEETYESLMMKIIGVEKPIPWIQGGVALAQRGLLEEAAFCCDRALALDRRDRKAMQVKALCLNDLGRFHEALEIFDHLSGLLTRDEAGAFICPARWNRPELRNVLLPDQRP